MNRYTRTILLFTLIMGIVSPIFAQQWKKDFKELINSSISKARTNPADARIQINEAYQIALDHSNHWMASNAQSAMGYLSNVNRDYATAHINYTSALKELDKSDTVDYPNLMAIHQNLALIYRKYKNYDQAITHYQKSEEALNEYKEKFDSLFTANNHQKYAIDIPYNMALAYRDKGDFKNSGEILIGLWDKSDYKRDTVSLAKVLVQLGLIQQRAEDYQQAEFYFGMVVSSDGISEKLKGVAYHNLGALNLEMGLTQTAQRYYQEALSIKRSSNASKRSQFITYLDLGELALQGGDTQKAIEYWKNGLEVYSNVGGEPELFEVYNWLQLAYMDVDLEKAKEYNLLYSTTSKLWAQNQADQKLNAEFYALQNDINKIRAKKENQTLLIDFLKASWAFVLGVLLTVTVLIYQVVGILSRRKKRKRLQKAARVLEESDY